MNLGKHSIFASTEHGGGGGEGGDRSNCCTKASSSLRTPLFLGWRIFFHEEEWSGGEGYFWGLLGASFMILYDLSLAHDK